MITCEAGVLQKACKTQHFRHGYTLGASDKLILATYLSTYYICMCMWWLYICEVEKIV